MGTQRNRGFFAALEDEEEEGELRQEGKERSSDAAGESVDSFCPEATIRSEIRHSGKDVNRNSG